MKHRAALFSVVACLSACTVDPEPEPRRVLEEPYSKPTTTPQTVQIVEGAPLRSAPGEGAGLFVEYRGGGEWYVWTACDTKITGLSCKWDVFVNATTGSIDRISPAPDPKANGTVSLADGTAALRAFNTTQIDGMTFHVSEPTAPVKIEGWLDGKADPRVFYWTGPMVIHEGAPTNPVIFSPP